MRIWSALFLFPIVLFVIGTAHATTSSTVTGSFIGTQMPTTLETRTAGNNTFESASGGLFKFIGGIRGEGPFVKASIIIHNSTLRAEFKAEFAFGGTVGGSQPGTMDIRIVAVFIETMTSDGGLVVTVTGTIILGGGTGGLAGIHGEGIVSGLSISPNYSVNVSFGPA